MPFRLEPTAWVDHILPTVLPIKVLSADAREEGSYVQYCLHAQQSDAHRRWRTAQVPGKL